MRILIIVIALFIVCCESVEADATVKEVIMPTEVNIVTEVEIDLDDLVFAEAFALQHRAKGENRTFWWHGSLYTTNLADVDQFVLEHVDLSVDKMAWVLNNDDPDDDCYYNVRDECGVCNGDGKVTWFRDKDGDGLGTHKEWVESCTNPNKEVTHHGTKDLGSIE